jgi:putative membrane protein
MMFWYGAHWAFWQVSLMWLGMIAFWGLLIWAVYALIIAATRNPPRHASSAREILNQRLARGDIDEAEYKRLCDLISSNDQRDSASAVSTR